MSTYFECAKHVNDVAPDALKVEVVQRNTLISILGGVIMVGFLVMSCVCCSRMRDTEQSRQGVVKNKKIAQISPAVAMSLWRSTTPGNSRDQSSVAPNSAYSDANATATIMTGKHTRKGQTQKQIKSSQDGRGGIPHKYRPFQLPSPAASVSQEVKAQSREASVANQQSQALSVGGSSTARQSTADGYKSMCTSVTTAEQPSRTPPLGPSKQQRQSSVAEQQSSVGATSVWPETRETWKSKNNPKHSLWRK